MRDIPVALVEMVQQLCISFFLLLTLLGSVTWPLPAHALVVNITGLGASAGSGSASGAGSESCSRTCESMYCEDPLFLRYGKYCGVGYTGCPGEVACDGLDACCQDHDRCIGDNLDNYLNVTCNQGLLDCVARYEASGGRQFAGNSCNIGGVEDAIHFVIELAVDIGKHLRR